MAMWSGITVSLGSEIESFIQEIIPQWLRLRYNTSMVQKTLEKTKKLVWPEIDKNLKDLTYPSQFVIPKKYNKEISLFWKINRDYPERQGK